MTYFKRTLAIFALFIISIHAIANEIDDRMDAMKAIGKSNKALSNISRGKADFDSQTVIQNAQLIAKYSGQSFTMLFPENSLSADSAAKAEIWQDWEKFNTLADELNTTANALSTDSTADNFNELYKRMSDTCSGCHRAFRAKK